MNGLFSAKRSKGGKVEADAAVVVAALAVQSDHELFALSWAGIHRASAWSSSPPRGRSSESLLAGCKVITIEKANPIDRRPNASAILGKMYPLSTPIRGLLF